MKMSTKCRYGARAVMEIARYYEDGPVKRRDISKNQNISDSYLENILIALKNAGIIDTIRGANGGYMLRRPPEEINLLEIITALEGSLALVDCVENPSMCDRVEQCATRVVWIKLQKVKEGVLKETTIKEMVDHEKKSFVPDYTI